MSSAESGASGPRVGRLTVWEAGATVFVGWEGAEEDWIASFAKDEEFPARAWAERMADLYNGEGTPDPPGVVGSHAPPG